MKRSTWVLAGLFILSLHIGGEARGQACNVPGAPSIVFVPPGNVGVGQTYVIVWSPAANLDDDGSYLVERSTNAAFNERLEVQQIFGTSASFIAADTDRSSYHHRVRAQPGCDPTKIGPYSAARTVSVVAGRPSVIFTVQPKAVITNLGDSLSSHETSLVIENISRAPVTVSEIDVPLAPSPNFFDVVDPDGGDLTSLTLEPRTPKRLLVRFLGVPTSQRAAFQGVVFLTAATGGGQEPLTITPYAFVNLKIGSSESLPPVFRIGGTPTEYVFFPGFAGTDDRTRPPVEIDIANPGTSPMELGAEIGPEVWLLPESGWNSQPIAPNSSRRVRLFTDRSKALNGSALPRYTYFTVRSKTGQTARLLVQDNDIPPVGGGRALALDATARSYIVPQIRSSLSPSGKRFFSTLRLSNTGSEVLPAELLFTPTGSDGFGSSVKRATILIPRNDVVALTDPLGQVFGFTTDVSGQVEIRAAEERIGSLTVSSTAVSPVASGGSVGYKMPALLRGEGARLNSPHIISGVTASATIRTDLILAETSGADRASVRVALFDQDGTRRGDRLISLPRYGQEQMAGVIAALNGPATLEAGRLELQVESGGGVAAGVAVITDTTKESAAALVSQPADGAVSLATYESSSQKVGWADTSTQSIVVPIVVNGPLAAGLSRSYQTILGLTAPRGSIATFILKYFDFEKGGQSATRTLTIPARKTIEFRNVLKDLFDIPFDAKSHGPMLIQTTVGGTVYARLSSDSGTSATGSLPFFATVSQAITSASSNAQRPLMLDGLEQSVDPTRGTRWVVVLTEIGERAAIVTIRLYEAGNRTLPIAEKDFTIGALQQRRLDTIFSEFGLDSEERRKDRTNVLAVVTPKSGSGLVSATAIAIDNRTGDATTHLFAPAGGVPATGVQNVSPVRPIAPVQRRRGARRGN